jgi:hypothetical protein
MLLMYFRFIEVLNDLVKIFLEEKYSFDILFFMRDRNICCDLRNGDVSLTIFQENSHLSLS